MDLFKNNQTKCSNVVVLQRRRLLKGTMVVFNRLLRVNAYFFIYWSMPQRLFFFF